MRIPINVNRRPVGFNMTPMIDVVFLLIIFFLVSSHLAQRESRIEMDLPIAVSGASDQPDDSKRVTINILADGQMSVAGRAIVESDLNQVFDAARAGSDKIEIRIRGDRATTYDSVSPVLKAITEAGIWDVSFAVVEESSR